MENQDYQPPSPRTRGIQFETYEEELAQPLTITVQEIHEDLKKYTDRFPYHVIPHVTRTAEINDVIHNYNNTGGKNALQKAKEQLEKADKFIPPNERLPYD